MSQIFISYASSDLIFVREHAVPICRTCGYDPWYDKEGIDAADPYERVIVEALRASELMLLVMSPDSADSEWVRSELDVAIRKGIHVIPLMLRSCDPLDFHIHLPRLQYIDFSTNLAEASEALARRLTGDEPAPPVREGDLTADLITITASLLTRFELKHLRNLHAGRTQYTGRRSMRHELRRLCDLGLLRRLPGAKIGEMKDGQRCDIAQHVELSNVGAAIVPKLPPKV